MAHNFPSDSASLKPDAVLVVAELKSFAAFDRSMDEQLAQLVALWIHTAAPNASRGEQVRRRFGR
jgi:hypothetical protein